MSTRSTRVPSYRHHKASGQARVTIDGADHYLGVYDSPESKERYRKVLAENLGKQPRTIAQDVADEDALAAVTIETVIAAIGSTRARPTSIAAPGSRRPSCLT
jgi:hypothetical protein